MTGATVEPVSRAEHLMERIYDRWGHRGFELYALAAWLTPALLASLTTLCTARYFDLSSSEYWRALAVVEVAIAASCGWASVAWYRKGAALRKWLRTAPRPEPSPALWKFAIAAPLWCTRVWGLRETLAALPAGALAIALVKHISVADAGMIFAGLFLTQLFPVLLCLFTTELAMRPMARDLEARVPSSTPPPPAAISVELKLFLGVLALVLASSFVVGSLVVQRGSGAAALVEVAAISIAVSLTLSMLVAVVYSAVVMGPVRDLLRGTRAVRDGDLEVHVPVLSDDAFGRLTASFNAMVQNLHISTDELRASRARLVVASDAERRRVERNIHDGAQQQLVALAVKLRMLQERVQGDEELTAAIAEIEQRLRSALEDLRELARGLHPSVLTTDGLPPALAQLAARASLPVAISAPQERFSQAVESTTYFVVSEALANVAKYAEASKAEVSIERRNGRLVMEIMDDGNGGAKPSHGSGLAGLADRVAALGGTLTVDSPDGVGTTVRAELPLR